MEGSGSQDPNNPFADVSLEEGDFGDLTGDMGEENDFTDQDSLLTGDAAAKATASSPSLSSGGAKAGGMCSCFTVQYYQPYFDVDTAGVQTRVVRSLMAFQPGKRDFLSITQDNADIYGPFWIITTLVFVIGATSNFSSYLGFVASEANPRWYYDFTLMTGAAGLCYGFGFGVPVGMWEEHFGNAGVSKSASSTLLGSTALVQIAFCLILKLYFFRSIGNIAASDPVGNSTTR
eukprot:g1163.t1